MTDSKARINNSSAVYVYLKAAEFRWFQQNSQDMFESNLVLKFREMGWLHLFLLPRSSADRAFLGCWGKFGQLNTDHYRSIGKCTEDLRAAWYGDGKKEAGDYAKLDMHNI